MNTRPIVPGRPRWSRRDLLRAGGLAAGAAALPALAGCGGDSGGGGGDKAQLQFMYWGSSFEQKAINAMLKQFEDKYDGVSVKPVYTPNEYDTKVNTLVASKRAPDVAYMGGSMGYRLAEQGKLVNLAKYFKKYPALADRLPGTYFWYGKDKTFGTQTANEVMLLWYNRAVMKDAGVEPPPAEAGKAWSWDEFVQAAYKLTRDQNGKRPDESGFDPKRIRQFGASVSVQSSTTWESFLRSNGAAFVDESGRKCLLDQPKAVEVFQNLQDLMYKHHVAPTPVQLGNNAPATNVQLQTKRIAMAVDGQWVLLDMAQSKVDFGIGVLPRYGEPATTQLGGASVVFSGSKYPEEAVELFMFHNDPRYVDLFKNGLWMPLEKKYYTDPRAIDSWIKNDSHPPEYRTAVVDYTLNHAQTAFGQRLKNMDNISEVLTPALQRIETGKQPAKEVLTALVPKIDRLLQGWYPSQTP
ncbi:ABC transporter substrate-binding protein [Actinopolymorpha singaporensis]|uniref:Carbohydrate ABC transporter substrate-binding protein, CUT1 family n=1 Tax=Actinopolymorpha singaporensis TaxID=117157 RepID=A0A1H1LKN4_9ACTN|nr:sugar ABC transporter substrate-binding protein [Actinopolymorpha singaporensis]SDR74910.1 carbohydrate ABC transporter substrate-binding protein, CUT1 family [Actinopolymorpha singaporensis]